MRADGRENDELRPILFERNFTDQTPGSVLVSFGRTKVLCTVSIDDDVPDGCEGKAKAGSLRSIQCSPDLVENA